MGVRNDETIFCTGYSRLPDGMAAKNLYGVMGVGFEIDPESDKIVNASCTFVTNMCNDFIKSILVGHDLKNGVDLPIQKFERRYFGLGKKAIVSAIRDAYNQFEIYKSMTYAEAASE
ncbi:hypothetical protein BRE01_09390 [Brevibacillus reuszeri]|uniref:DUF3870 domain-containing protein n=1 Tax=Brevibacillus reuszeri TaxID=54915 RepID=A0A0K9YS70_9BACL|nr:DUF3870 domain-containing protein [Brevibacillus reuszeri]KNB71574.1 hypothetical protein ADS79_22685 [Brevibacillus reuszeri]MED1855613.1 DUF3870 domain-containing protein [Brevibacillus reuszeri]GED67237.1 hypothetical protein BRE01_09390 [Brevibacillus reuszeri]GIO07697.1 hypothetical protein J31TS6_37250 [Brevibacillus reuszeri]